MRFTIALLSFPTLIWAWVQFPFLNQFDWKWLLAAFFLYCYALIRELDHAVERSRDFGRGRSYGGGDSTGYGDFGGGCDGGGGDC